MALPSTGALSMSQVAVELSRTATAQIALGEAAVRNLAGLPNGPIGLLNLRGKSAAIIYTASNLASLNLATAFGTDYGAAVDKRLIVPSVITLGPVTIPTGLAGSLTIENAGEIQGLGGAANGGAGGDAITASSSFTLVNTGAVRGGGGGGGLGGVGGQGSATVSVREPTSGERYQFQGSDYYSDSPFGGARQVRWSNSTLATPAQGSTQTTIGSFTYFRGNRRDTIPPQFNAPFPIVYYGIFRTSSSTTITNGGAGGAGGIGRGYNQVLASGAAGANGGPNAGTGGSGGTGGDWGQAGATGGSGANGNSTNGGAGSAGGAAGRAVRMLSGSLTLTNSGTLNGAY